MADASYKKFGGVSGNDQRFQQPLPIKDPTRANLKITTPNPAQKKPGEVAGDDQSDTKNQIATKQIVNIRNVMVKVSDAVVCADQDLDEIGDDDVMTYFKFGLYYADIKFNCKTIKVEDAVSRAADGTSAAQELDFSSLRSQLGSLAAILLCVDVATSSAKTAIMLADVFRNNGCFHESNGNFRVSYGLHLTGQLERMNLGLIDVDNDVDTRSAATELFPTRVTLSTTNPPPSQLHTSPLPLPSPSTIVAAFNTSCCRLHNLVTSICQKMAQVMLSEIYPGGSPKIGSTYWDQIHEVGIISVTRRVLKRLHELLEQDKPPALQAIFSGDTIISSSKDLHWQGHRERALSMLHQMIEDAHKGKRQFLSGTYVSFILRPTPSSLFSVFRGIAKHENAKHEHAVSTSKLHNLARAVADEETERDYMKGEGPYADRKLILNHDKDGVLGLGLRSIKQMSPPSATGENNVQPTGYDLKDPGRRLFGPLSAKTTTYLSQFILHIAAIGDIVDGTDTTHDFNYFSLVYEWPKDLLTRLVFERGSTDAAGKIAEIMFADFVHEVISASVPPVYPPRSGHGWACIPVTPTSPKSFQESKVFSPSSKDAKPNSYGRSSAIPGIPLYPLQLDIVKHLVKLSAVRAVLACVFGSGILHRGNDSTICSSLNDGLLQTPDDDRLFYEFSLDQSERFPTLNRWIQMQTNLHRVSEFAVAAEHETEDGIVKSEQKTAIKRYREHDSDSESEADDIAVSANISTALPDLHSPMNAASDPRHESPKSEVPGLDTRVFLSLDWENEGPYEKAVDRY
ncbi:hypothetical protein U1Q18_018754 [Sarracenia purpurea var. burkii]